MNTALFAPDDMERASDLFGAMCGHGALAAAIGENVMTVEHVFERAGGWVNLPQMLKAIELLPRHEVHSQDTIWDRGRDEMQLVLIQFTGSWMEPGVPPAARCKYRHWIAAKGELVWDANESDFWFSYAEWRDGIVPGLLPKRATGWRVFRALILEHV